MTISLLISRQSRGALVLADPGGVGAEAVLAVLASQLEAQRLIYPLADRLPQRLVPPPSLMRSRHADLWHALSEERRDRVRLVAGPTAAFLAPVMPTDSQVVVALPDPNDHRGPDLWRSVLGAFPEFDEMAEAPESDRDRERWLARIREATSGLALVRVADLNDVAMEVAAALGLSPKRAARLTAAAEPGGEPVRQDGQRMHWIDEVLYSLARPAHIPTKRRQA